MKLYDALRNDSELREDLVELLDKEEVHQFNVFASIDPTDVERLRACKADVNALRRIRGMLLREDTDGRPRRV